MGSVSDIAQAVMDVVGTLPDVDYTSISDFTPAIQSQKVAALCVAFGQSSSGEPETMDPTMVTLTHRLRVEFWVKHVQGKAADTMQRGRDISTEAIAALMVNDGDGYELALGAFEETVDPVLVSHNQSSWLVATLTVPVRNVIAVGD